MQNKNTGLLVLVVVLLLVVIGLSGYIIYDKTITKNSNQNTPENNSIISNSYELYTENLKNELKKYDSNNQNYQFISNDIIEEGYEVYLDEKGSLYVQYFNDELNNKYGKYKIADKVLCFSVINVGQDIGNMIYFINENGTVGSADTEYGVIGDNQIAVEKNIGYTNIVSIIPGLFGDGFSGARGPIFIDINGKLYGDF